MAGRGSGFDFQATAASLMDMQEQMAALMRQDQTNNSSSSSPRIPGQGAFASFVAPLEVTRRVKSQIKSLPVAGRGSKNSTWMVHTLVEQEEEGTSSTCTVHQVTMKKGSNGLTLAESDGLGMSLAMCATLDPTNSMSNRPSLLLGTIAKACLTPCSMGNVGANFDAVSMFDVRPYRPRRILFQTRGELEMLAPDLKKIGITNMRVAEPNLVRSLELHNSALNDAQYTQGMIEGIMQTGADPRTLGEAVLAQSQALHDPYVDETPMPMGSWVTPQEPGDLPARWFARPPEDRNSWRPTALLGWRTNLERALMREDGAKVNTIVAERNVDDIREFVECRMLLTKCAQRGLLVACNLLIEKCGASVEGAQAPDAKPWWKVVQDASGSCDSLTPLHQACRNGQAKSVKLLLDHGADINRIDKANVQGSALHHAVSTGQVDCCRIICKYGGADHTYQGMGGEALDISELVADGDVYRARVQEKVQQILREFDERCSYCRHPNPSKLCPCKKEIYCDVECQKKRWKKHQTYHKEIVGGS